MMRRMCMGQHKALQDTLRKQRLNKISYNFFDEAVNYLIFRIHFIIMLIRWTGLAPWV